MTEMRRIRGNSEAVSNINAGLRFKHMRRRVDGRVGPDGLTELNLRRIVLCAAVSQQEWPILSDMNSWGSCRGSAIATSSKLLRIHLTTIHFYAPLSVFLPYGAASAGTGAGAGIAAFFAAILPA